MSNRILYGSDATISINGVRIEGVTNTTVGYDYDREEWIRKLKANNRRNKKRRQRSKQ